MNLPLDGAVGRALGDPRATGWGNVEELLAALIETVDAGNRLYFRAHTKKGKQQPKPIKVPRPERTSGKDGDVPERKPKRQATSEEMRAFFGGAARYTGPRVDAVSSSSGNPVTSPAVE